MTIDSSAKQSFGTKFSDRLTKPLLKPPMCIEVLLDLAQIENKPDLTVVHGIKSVCVLSTNKKVFPEDERLS
jgi:hypothetical protein